MLITINLLPEKEKINLKREKAYQMIFISVLILSLTIAIIGLEVFFAKKILQESLFVFIPRITYDEEFVEKIKKLNFELTVINEIQNNYLEIVPLFTSLSQLTPKNSFIKFFSLDREKKTFQIKGWAKTRKELLEFQRGLENSGIFVDIQAPLSNLLKEEDIDFEFSGKLNI